jgi:hypothetical protein
VTVKNYRPVAYAYVTGPEPKASGNYPYDGPRGEKDMNRGRITLPRGADLARLREKGALQQCADCSDGTLILTIPKAPANPSMPTPEYVTPSEAGCVKTEAQIAAVDAAAAAARLH